MKKLVILALIFLLAIGLIGCGSSAQPLEHISGLTGDAIDKVIYEPLITQYAKTEITDPEEIATLWQAVDREYTTQKAGDSVGAKYKLIFCEDDYQYTMWIYGESQYVKDTNRYTPDTPIDLAAIDAVVATHQ